MIDTYCSTLEVLAQNLSSLSVKVQERSEKDAAKKAAKAEAKEEREAEKRASSKVFIKRIERNKRKYVTAVSGLEAFGLDLKKTAKEFGKKFATGSSVTKVPGGGEEITVQGDVSAEIEEYILDTYKDVPEDNVEIIEDKKKKGWRKFVFSDSNLVRHQLQPSLMSPGFLLPCF